MTIWIFFRPRATCTDLQLQRWQIYLPHTPPPPSTSSLIFDWGKHFTSLHWYKLISIPFIDVHLTKLGRQSFYTGFKIEILYIMIRKRLCQKVAAYLSPLHHARRYNIHISFKSSSSNQEQNIFVYRIFLNKKYPLLCSINYCFKF